MVLISHAFAFPTISTKKSPRLAGISPHMLPRSWLSTWDVRCRLQPLLTAAQPLVHVWRSDVPSTFTFDYSQERNTSKLILEAESLRAQAKAIMEQALAMEKELKESRLKRRTSKLQEVDEYIQQWFRSDGGDNSCLANVTIVASRLEEQNVSQKQVLLVGGRIFDLQMQASGQTAFLEQRNEPSYSQSATEERSPDHLVIQNETMYEYFSEMAEILSKAVALVDDRVAKRTDPSRNARWTGRVTLALQAHLNELRRTQKINMDRKVAAEINKVTRMTTGSLEEFVRRNIVGQVEGEAPANSTRVSAPERKMDLVPLWVPAVFLPFIVASKSLSLGPAEVTGLLDDVFMGSRFYVTSHNSVPGAAIFRGNIRGAGVGNAGSEEQPSTVAFADVQKRLEKMPGLRDRVQLFLLSDPEWRMKQGDNEAEAKPVILALSKNVSPDQAASTQRWIVPTGKVRLGPAFVISIICFLALTCVTFRRNYCIRWFHSPYFGTQ
jgi:hypothetical protein